MPVPIPAATLVLFRAGDDGRPDEHLFVERAKTMSFAAGAIVFPGGRVDPGDTEQGAAFMDLAPVDAAARVAAIRETIEECGVAVGLTPPPTEATIDRLRAGLLAGRAFADLLREEVLQLDLGALRPFTRWCPNLPETRVFDTRFYVARMPANHPPERVDATENVRLFWASAQRVLDDAAAGTVRIIFPTRCNLERLAALGSFAAAAQQLDTLPAEPPLIAPWVALVDGEEHLCIPEGQGYPTTSQRLPDAFRG